MADDNTKKYLDYTGTQRIIDKIKSDYTVKSVEVATINTKPIVFNDSGVLKHNKTINVYVDATNSYIIDGDSTHKGIIRLCNSKYGSLYPNTLTDNRSWYLPDKTGTIALTSDLVDEKVKHETASTAGTYGIGIVNKTGSNPGYVYYEDGFDYTYTDGTTTTEGIARLTLGNSTANGIAGNQKGSIRFYSNTDKYTELFASIDQTAGRTIYLPNKNGTIALTSDLTDEKLIVDELNPTSGSTQYIHISQPNGTAKHGNYNKGFYSSILNGTSSTAGYVQLHLGRVDATNGHQEGQFRLYTTDGHYVNVRTQSGMSSDAAVNLPNKTGTIALVDSDIVAIASFPSGKHFNDIAKYGNAVGWANNVASGDNPGGSSATGKKFNFLNMSYRVNSTTLEHFITQIANESGTTDLWVRSIYNKKIVDNVVWDAPWTRILTGTNWSNVITKSSINLDSLIINDGSTQGISYNGNGAKTLSITGDNGAISTAGTANIITITHSTANGYKHIPSGGSSGQFLAWDSTGTAKWVNNPNSDYKVRQTNSTTNADYRLLLSQTANDTQVDNITYKSSKLTFNPSTGLLHNEGDFDLRGKLWGWYRKKDTDNHILFTQTYNDNTYFNDIDTEKASFEIGRRAKKQDGTVDTKHWTSRIKFDDNFINVKAGNIGFTSLGTNEHAYLGLYSYGLQYNCTGDIHFLTSSGNNRSSLTIGNAVTNLFSSNEVYISSNGRISLSGLEIFMDADNTSIKIDTENINIAHSDYIKLIAPDIDLSYYYYYGNVQNSTVYINKLTGRDNIVDDTYSNLPTINNFQEIHGRILDGLIHRYRYSYYTCSTAQTTAAKVITGTQTQTKDNFSSNFLVSGAKIAVKFTNGSKVANATLNINSTGAKPIYYNGATITANNVISANRVYELIYNTANNGYWEIIGDLDTNTTYTISNKTITFTLNGTTFTNNSFTLNQTTDKTISIPLSTTSAPGLVPVAETANNAKFLRNDNSWQTVTPANIGAATSAQGTKADNAMPKSGGTFTGGITTQNVTVPTNYKITLTDAPVNNTDAANKSYVDSKIAESDAMVYCGTISQASDIPNTPIVGDTYKASAKFTLPAAKSSTGADVTVNIGDLVIAQTISVWDVIPSGNDITGVIAGTGLTGGGTAGSVTLNHSNSITAGTVSEGGNARTLAYGGTFNIPSITYDAQGHITSTTTTQLTLPASDNTTGTNIQATNTTNADYRLLLSTVANDSAETNKAPIKANSLWWNNSSKTLSVRNSSGTDVSLILDRNANASWKFLNSAGVLKLQNNYTTAKGDYFDVAVANYNTGNIAISKGNLTVDKGNLSVSTGTTYSKGNISTDGKFVGTLNNSLKIQLNSGTTEGTNQFTFNNSAGKTINITPANIGAATSGHTHDLTIATDTGTSDLTLAHGGKYKLTSGGNTFVFTMPSDNNTTYTYFTGATGTSAKATTDTTNPYLILRTGTTNQEIQLKAGTNVTSITANNNVITFNVKDTTYSAGVGLALSGTTFKAKLKSETASTLDSATVETTASRQYAVHPDKSGYLSVNVPWTDTNTKVTSVNNHYAPAEDTSAELSVDASSTTAATWNTTSLVTGINLQRDAKGHVVGVTVDSIKIPANPNTTYTLGSAANSTNITLTPSSGSANNVSITGTSPITVSGATKDNIAISHANSGATAGNYGDSSAQTPGFGGTFKVPYVTVNATGHITGISEHTVTLPNNPDNDIKVRQTLVTTENTTRPLLLAYSNSGTTTANIDNISYRNNSLTYNSSTAMLTTPKLTLSNAEGITFNTNNIYKLSTTTNGFKLGYGSGNTEFVLANSTTKRVSITGQLAALYTGTIDTSDTDPTQVPIETTFKVWDTEIYLGNKKNNDTIKTNYLRMSHSHTYLMGGTYLSLSANGSVYIGCESETSVGSICPSKIYLRNSDNSRIDINGKTINIYGQDGVTFSTYHSVLDLGSTTSTLGNDNVYVRSGSNYLKTSTSNLILYSNNSIESHSSATTTITASKIVLDTNDLAFTGGVATDLKFEIKYRDINLYYNSSRGLHISDSDTYLSSDTSKLRLTSDTAIETNKFRLYNTTVNHTIDVARRLKFYVDTNMPAMAFSQNILNRNYSDNPYNTTFASGNVSAAFGDNTIATGDYSFITGYGNTSSLTTYTPTAKSYDSTEKSWTLTFTAAQITAIQNLYKTTTFMVLVYANGATVTDATVKPCKAIIASTTTIKLIKMPDSGEAYDIINLTAIANLRVSVYNYSHGVISNNSFVTGLSNISIDDNQTIIGKYNATGNYAFIIGGGSISGTTITRKNIFTVDWSGNVITNGGQTINGNITFSQLGDSGTRGIIGYTGTNDYWRIVGGATASNAGYTEWATADDSNEPIYVRQYTGQFTTLKRTLTLLDASGNTSIPGNLTVTGTSTLTGNVTTSGTFTGNGSGLTSLNGSNISSGTVALARGGTGASTAEGALTNFGLKLYEFTKSLTFGADWVDTGIAGTNLATGSYIVQVTVVGSSTVGLTNETFTGYMSWYQDTCASTVATSDEILLHQAGSNKGQNNGIYLRTIRVANGTMKLQMSASFTYTTATSIVFKFRRMI